MRILLQWLIEHAWIFYVVCGMGALIYLVRALVAQRERSLALFTLEHETATARAVRGWVGVFVFTALALLVFIGVTYALPRLPIFSPGMPLPTSTPSSGLEPPTQTVTVTATTSITLPTLPAQTATPALPTPTLDLAPTATPGPTETPTPTPLAPGVVSGEMDVAFGDFGRLVAYQLSSTQVSAGQPIVLTLTWQGLEGTSPADYTVFTHLLAPDGNLLAQHDGPPAGGNAPTSGWQAGETIVDTHQMAFRSAGQEYAGPATIVVGLYDPEDVGARVITSGGQDQVSLPVTIDVVSE
jgi:hypothetical protein